VPGQTRIGRIYKKALYREYTDSSFSKPKDIEGAWKHLGILGPIIRAQVGDTIRVVFRNRSTTRPYSIHPHGVFYDKASEGMGMPGMDSSMESQMGIAAPGATITYTWPVPVRAGPGSADGSSVVWLYHSHVDEPQDVNSGLVGPIIVTAAGQMRSDGRPIDVDREFVALFTIFNENLSWYLDANILKVGSPDSVSKEDEGFQESNLKHSINGYLYSNLPDLKMKKDERVRWYLMGLGTEADIHTPHWHGNTVLVNGHRADVGALFPATTAVYDMTPDDPGTWMFHCHVNDHIVAGMIAQYTVDP
jgi:FtsP/CotA-like multicopper oxidase with cupredoxin domain